MKPRTYILPIALILFSVNTRTPLAGDRGLSNHGSPIPQKNDFNWGLESIRANKNLNQSQQQKEIIVAVIDTGVDKNHEYLKEALWKNLGEVGKDHLGRDKETNGIDDDQNGFVDDFQGWNFTESNNDITDYHGHGTHIAGIISGRHPQNQIRTSLTTQTKLMVLKYYDPSKASVENLRNTIKAIHYAVKMGAHIINYSSGGIEPSRLEQKAIEWANRKNVLFVTAAGNEASNLDEKGYYPADYDLPNILSVTAHDRRYRVLSSSNYGAKTVDIAAPGENILSCLPGSKYGLMTGTSQATAFVSGLAALILAKYSRYLAPFETKHYILESLKREKALMGKTKTEGRIEVLRALSMRGSSADSSGRGIDEQSQKIKEEKLMSLPLIKALNNPFN